MRNTETEQRALESFWTEVERLGGPEKYILSELVRAGHRPPRPSPPRWPPVLAG